MAEFRGTKLDDSQISSAKLNKLFENTAHVKKPIFSSSELPATGNDGEQIFVKNEKMFYMYEESTSSWTPVSASKSDTDASIVELQDQIDAIKQAIDDDGDGSIVDTIQNLKDQWSSTDTSLQGLIDQKVDQTTYDTKVSELNSKIEGEITSRANEDSALHTSISDEVARATGEESRIEGKVDSEISIRQSAFSSLDTRITDIEDEIIASSDSMAKGTLAPDGTTIIPKTFSSLDLRLEEIETDSSTEVERATGEESRIEGKIDQEISDRSTAISSLENQLATETNSRSSADSAINLRIDNALTAISNEENARSNADETLQSSIENEVTRATGEESRIEGKIDQEVLDRQSAISSIETQVSGINSNKADKAGSLTGDFSIKNLTISGDILPTTNSIQNIGSPTARFSGIYVDEAYLSTNTLYIGDTPILGTSQDTIQIKADPGQSINMATTGVGLTQISSVNGVQMSTSGMNGDIKVQATGNGSRVVMSATNAVELAATNINLNGMLDIKGATSLDALTVRGNLNVQGTTTTVNSTSLAVKDNIIEVNQGEVGAGVTLGQAGLKVDRGDAADYYMVFDESDDMFKVGMAGQLETIASQPFVTGKFNTVQTELGNYKTVNDTRVGNIETTNTTQGNSISAIQTELTSARSGLTSLDERLDAIDSLIAGKASVNHSHVWSDITNVPTATTSVSGIVQLSALTNSTSTTLAATASAVKSAYDLANSKASTSVATTSANGLMSSTDKSKLDGVAEGANNYVHPVNHPASIITQDASNRFVSDTEKATWNGKASTSVATTSANGLMSSTDKSKLDGVQSGAINQTTADGRYIQSSGGNMSGALSFGNRIKMEYNSADDSLDFVVL